MVVMHDPVYRYMAGNSTREGQSARGGSVPFLPPAETPPARLCKGPSKINEGTEFLLLENPFHTFLRATWTDLALKLALL